MNKKTLQAPIINQNFFTTVKFWHFQKKKEKERNSLQSNSSNSNEVV